jgi:homeobox-leucine zipper protein
MDENAVGTCAELIFAPIDATFADDAPLLPSVFRIIPLDSGKVSLLDSEVVYFSMPIY